MMRCFPVLDWSGCFLLHFAGLCTDAEGLSDAQGGGLAGVDPLRERLATKFSGFHDRGGRGGHGKFEGIGEAQRIPRLVIGVWCLVVRAIAGPACIGIPRVWHDPFDEAGVGRFSRGDGQGERVATLEVMLADSLVMNIGS